MVTVNSDVILSSDIKYAKSSVLKLANSKKLLKNKSLDNVIQQLINNKLQVQYANKHGIKSSVEETDEMIKKIAKSNNITVKKLHSDITSKGMDYNRFRQSIAEQSVIQRLQNTIIQSKVAIAEQEINQVIKKRNKKVISNIKINLIHVLIPKDDENQNLSYGIRKKWQEGQDIKSFVNNPNLEIKKLGWQDKSSLPVVLYDAVFALNKGDVSEVIKLANGFHILKVIDKRGGGSKKETQLKARHILIRASRDSDVKAIARQITDIRTQIINGKDFAMMAAEFSEDPGSAKKGGDLGWFSQGSMVAEFEKTAYSLKINQISNPFITEYGFHILQVTNKRDIDIDNKKLREKIKKQIYAKKAAIALEEWQKTIRVGAFIKIME